MSWSPPHETTTNDADDHEGRKRGEQTWLGIVYDDTVQLLKW